MFLEKIQNKIVELSMIADRIGGWKAKGERIVFTNGCFDLIHYGHLHYLAEARDLGDRLVVGVNSDASVQRLKGVDRPVKDEKTRMFLLAALSFVDAVVLFDDDTPTELIAMVQPDVLVKGGDYSIDKIVGANIVLEAGGEVMSLPFVEGFSTTNYFEKIKSGKRDDL